MVVLLVAGSARGCSARAIGLLKDSCRRRRDLPSCRLSSRHPASRGVFSLSPCDGLPVAFIHFHHIVDVVELDLEGLEDRPSDEQWS